MFSPSIIFWDVLSLLVHPLLPEQVDPSLLQHLLPAKVTKGLQDVLGLPREHPCHLLPVVPCCPLHSVCLLWLSSVFPLAGSPQENPQYMAETLCHGTRRSSLFPGQQPTSSGMSEEAISTSTTYSGTFMTNVGPLKKGSEKLVRPC